MNRLSAVVLLIAACTKEAKPTEQRPEPRPEPQAVAPDAAPADVPVDAAEGGGQYRMEKPAGVSSLIKLDPLPAGWEREDGDSAVLTYKVAVPALEITVDLEPIRTSFAGRTPAEWKAAEEKEMVAKTTKTETVGNVTVFNFKADKEWFWAYAMLGERLWRCGTNLQEDQKAKAVQDAVATARKLCASMHL